MTRSSSPNRSRSTRMDTASPISDRAFADGRLSGQGTLLAVHLVGDLLAEQGFHLAGVRAFSDEADGVAAQAILRLAERPGGGLGLVLE